MSFWKSVYTALKKLNKPDLMESARFPSVRTGFAPSSREGGAERSYRIYPSTGLKRLLNKELSGLSATDKQRVLANLLDVLSADEAAFQKRRQAEGVTVSYAASPVVGALDGYKVQKAPEKI